METQAQPDIDTDNKEERIVCPVCKIDVLEDDFLYEMDICIYCLNEKDGW